jgi:hypothetical protein
MRVVTVLSALALSAVALPAEAAYTIYFNPISLQGTLTTSTYSSTCGGYCSGTTTWSATSINALGALSAPTLEGTLHHTTYDPGSKVGGTVELQFLAGVLQATSFKGYQSYMTGNCSENCTIYEGAYTAREFSILIQDGASAPRTVHPVPEPSTWAMMLLGFGAIGASLRRRPQRLTGKPSQTR